MWKAYDMIRDMLGLLGRGEVLNRKGIKEEERKNKLFFFVEQNTEYEISYGFEGSEMCEETGVCVRVCVCVCVCVCVGAVSYTYVILSSIYSLSVAVVVVLTMIIHVSSLHISILYLHSITNSSNILTYCFYSYILDITKKCYDHQSAHHRPLSIL